MSDNGSTSITYQETRSDAQTVKECANQMQSIFNEFESTMRRVGGSDVFVGDANESLQGRFARLKQRFTNYVKLVEDFNAMILGAAQAEEDTERALSQTAESLASSEKGN